MALRRGVVAARALAPQSAAMSTGIDRTRQSRPIDWAELQGKLTSDSAKAEFSRLRATYGEIQALAKTYSSSPEPIDFAGYKTKISTPGLVDSFEESYKNLTYKPVVSKEVDEVRENHMAMIAEADASVAESVARIEALKDVVAKLEASQVGYDTTLEQLYEAYPGLEAEIEAEIDAHDWGKDIN